MLRSIMIGLAVAALLQLATHSASSTRDLALTNVRTVSLECESASLLKLIAEGYSVLIR